ncbi:unnamed protein product [Dovyalis caffra]|uniref:DUF4220 domain-containing protein n=1 Tax=Dovyalis caffra TaxID=77055 RepID=A0AAV1SBE7_9ROSI|nr:unnamed protein product [Dovyalis caffra]
MITPDAGQNYSKFMEEFTLKQYEGFHVTADEVIEAQVKMDVSPMGSASICYATELLQAHYLFTTFKRLFVDLILGFQDRNNSQNLFKNMSLENALKVIEIELGFMFDVLYTKGEIIYAHVGCYLRFICLSSTFAVLIVYSISHEKNHSKKVDLAITFLFLVVAIFLDLYAVLLLFSSDWTDLYLTKHSTIGKALAPFQLPKHIRWSNSLARPSLLSFCLKSKPRTIDEVSDELNGLAFTHLDKFQYMSISSGRQSLNPPVMRVSVNHCASTEGIMCFKIQDFLDYLSWECSSTVRPKPTIALYAVSPGHASFHIANGDWKDQIRYLDTCKEVINVFGERESMLGDIQTSNHRPQNSWLLAINPFSKGKSKPNETKACKVLLNVNTTVPPVKLKGDRSKYLVLDACRLASQLQDISNREEKWKLVSNVWVEMLAYAGSRCNGNYHAQQLRQAGGELRRRVWLLMAHFGLTEQFQISHGHARAKISMARKSKDKRHAVTQVLRTMESSKSDKIIKADPEDVTRRMSSVIVGDRWDQLSPFTPLTFALHKKWIANWEKVTYSDSVRDVNCIRFHSLEEVGVEVDMKTGKHYPTRLGMEANRIPFNSKNLYHNHKGRL